LAAWGLISPPHPSCLRAGEGKGRGRGAEGMGGRAGEGRVGTSASPNFSRPCVAEFV